MHNNCFAYNARLKQIVKANCLHHIRHGIEKESLRTTPAGTLAQTRHPHLLGSALTHPYITTDYSEALLEFITPVFKQIDDMLSFLAEIQRYVIKHLDNEVLWCNSMPALLGGDFDIPVARYGSSNIAHMKHIYRVGLGYRYGRAMQTIAGIHYNFSLPQQFWEYVNLNDGSNRTAAGYMALIRNFKRYSWLLIYLFGSSPVVDKTFLRQNRYPLESLGDDTFCLPWATSLRMSRIGYTNELQDQLNICYNSIDSYIQTLSKAINTSYPLYEKIGVRHINQYQQLNSNILQIENEYYNSIRPKCIMHSGEKPLDALRRKVEYIEVRCLDIDPLLPLGLDDITASFLDIFLVFCAINDSPILTSEENNVIRQNFQKVVTTGRKPALCIDIFNESGVQAVPLQQQGAFLLNEMREIASALDVVHQSTRYSKSLSAQIRKINNSELTPSAQILNLTRDNGGSFIKTMQSLSEQHYQYFTDDPLPTEREQYFLQLANQSHEDQKKIEDEDEMTFDAYLKNYFSS